jgi:PAS domain S-box-containing protein
VTSALTTQPQQAKSHANVAAAIMLALMAAVVILLAANALSFRANLELALTEATDNRVWTTSQLEVDHKNLLLVLDDARTAAPGRIDNQLSLAFDIFYTRVEILYAVLDRGDLPPSLQSSLQKAKSSRDALAQQFDRLDLTNPTELAEFTATTQALSPLFRQITLESLDYFVDSARNTHLRDIMSWQRFLATSLFLIGLMATVMCIALLLRRQMAEQAKLVQSASSNIRMVYEASMRAVVVTDLDGKVVLFNRAAERLFGYSAAEMLGRNVAETMIPPSHMARHIRAMKRLREVGADALHDVRPRLATSLDVKRREFPIELTIHANRDANADTLLIAFIRDVSEQAAYENNLRVARDEARRHAASRTLFLATMSHEMRTPLHGLLASLELIDDAGQSPETRRLLATARNCALRSVSQINDVLDLIQIDESQEPMTAFAPVKVVTDIIAELAPLAQERNNTAQIRVKGEAKGQQWSGAAKTFARVMYNLIGNALKFSEDGTVWVDLTFQHDAINGHRLSVAVEDSGIGIAAEEQEHIFELFFSLPATGTLRRQGGTGLGLPIARKAVEKMGGQLGLESTFGKGSRFYFEIPLVAAATLAVAQDALPLPARPQHFDLTCMVVDDNIVNLELTAQMLRQLGCKVLALDNGAAAASATLQKHYDVIFMDLNMPGGMSGGEAARHIRNLEKIDPSRRASSCIVALTADTTFGSPSGLAEQSMDRVLHKPVRTPDLVQLLVSLENRLKQPAAPDQATQTVADFAEMNVLIGPIATKRLLAGVVSDLRSLQDVLANEADPQLQDVLHRAIGSTGMVGQAGLCLILSDAMRTLRKQGNLNAEFSTLFSACDLAIETIQMATDRSA